MKGLRLVRDANGKEVGLGSWSRVAPIRQPTSLSAPSNSGSATARKETTFSESIMHSDVSLKSNVTSDADAVQENVAPPAKRSLVVDLCSDEEDD